MCPNATRNYVYYLSYEENEMAYTEQEKEEFRARDLRISKAGILQALISSGQFTQTEILDGQLIKNITEMYRKWIWGENDIITVVEKSVRTISDIARDIALPKPTPQQEKILVAIENEYLKMVQSIDIGLLLKEIIQNYGTYPTKESSIRIVLNSIPVENIVCK